MNVTHWWIWLRSLERHIHLAAFAPNPHQPIQPICHNPWLINAISPRPPLASSSRLTLASRPPPQAVGISLCVAGFGESMVELLDLSWSWSEKAFAAGALLLLALINVAGVKWVIKVQFLLLLLVLLAAMDFIFGSFLDHSDGESDGDRFCCGLRSTASFWIIRCVSFWRLKDCGMKLRRQQPTKKKKFPNVLIKVIKHLEQVFEICTELQTMWKS